MKVVVDEMRCQGHNRCMVLAPEIFEVDELGFAHVKDPTVPIPIGLEDAVRRAVASCPEFAIVITEE